MHTAGSVWFALFALHRARLDRRWRIPAALAAFTAANIVVSTVVLRWHYVVDVLAGITLASTVAFAAARIAPWEEARRKRLGLPGGSSGEDVRSPQGREGGFWGVVAQFEAAPLNSASRRDRQARRRLRAQLPRRAAIVRALTPAGLAMLRPKRLRRLGHQTHKSMCPPPPARSSAWPWTTPRPRRLRPKGGLTAAKVTRLLILGGPRHAEEHHRGSPRAPHHTPMPRRRSSKSSSRPQGEDLVRDRGQLRTDDGGAGASANIKIPYVANVNEKQHLPS